MEVIEDKQYSADYLKSDKRSIGNAVQVFFKDGTESDKVEIEFPLGHRRRRQEGIPKLVEKFRKNLDSRFPEAQAERIFMAMDDHQGFMAMPANDFVSMLQV